ncbi:MAG: hypothetical protein ACR2G2_18755, partial [Pseudonocardia sp.]
MGKICGGLTVGVVTACVLAVGALVFSMGAGQAQELSNADFRVGDSAQPHRLERHTSCDSRGLLTCGYARSAAQTFST